MPRKTETYDEMADRIDTEYEAGLIPEEATPVGVRVWRPADVNYSIRFNREEIAMLRRHAEATGVKLSDFIRDAAIAAVASSDLEPRDFWSQLDRVAAQTRALQTAVTQLAGSRSTNAMTPRASSTQKASQNSKVEKTSKGNAVRSQRRVTRPR
jgi:uncharacterized protein (DUF1778 family)